ncbi:DUF2059 domain-containing protein [Altererythrobacter sp. H2]|uniref:DUF2059 domain-containing protein n=1 Tax=Altererythrobacter sp. H2 TaxID=3108391 RepID=UPI000BDC7276|nr:DUF2059 domain-containing protein [Altererythrobacter sp. H2]OZA94779.1 MAG: hypothetical protein B7X57_00305 [Erythrobacter sp. 34-65-8]WRK96288.1 DUF2059 domain-containing protein [Altererythrobacter sp. H2]
MKKGVALLVGAMALAIAQPAAAQDPAPDFSALRSAMGEMFTAEPLTAEQQARVPQAEQVVAQLFPAGTYRKMMDQMMGPMMDGIMGSIQNVPLADLARLGGVDESALSAMGDARLGELSAILDPAYEERNRIMGQVSVDMVTRLMDRIEPGYRAGLARAFATRFTAAELGELHGFFGTPVGARYAGESMLIYADPQVMSAMNEMMPAMLDMMPAMIEEMQAKTAHLPPARTAAELGDSELTRLAELLGVPADDLKAQALNSSEEPANAAW